MCDRRISRSIPPGKIKSCRRTVDEAKVEKMHIRVAATPAQARDVHMCKACSLRYHSVAHLAGWQLTAQAGYVGAISHRNGETKSRKLTSWLPTRNSIQFIRSAAQLLCGKEISAAPSQSKRGCRANARVDRSKQKHIISQTSNKICLKRPSGWLIRFRQR